MDNALDTNNHGDVSYSGTIEEVTYYNEDTCYAVVALLSEDGTLVPAVGTMPFVTEGEDATLSGTWTMHPEYGRQLLVLRYEKIMPHTTAAILRYLSSGSIKGIGKKTAARLVARYGESTFDVIENHPEWLSDISGISPKKAADIHKSFCEQDALRKIMMLAPDHISPLISMRAYKRWGGRAVDKIVENPYILCDEIFGVSFLAADALATALGGDPIAEMRLQSGLTYILDYNARANGHACLPVDKLLLAAEEALDAPQAAIVAALDAALADGQLVLHKSEGEQFVFSRSMDKKEKFVAKRLLELDRCVASFSTEDIERLVEHAEQRSGLIYATLQRRAIMESLTGGVLIVTGGPGTGKTTLIKAMVSVYKSLGLRMALVAPTGRAAKKMSEATGEEAQTLHRMLEMQRTETTEPIFRRNEENPLSQDVIIVDEASMIDLPLMDALLRATRRGMRFVFIGDADQLPSVGAGNVLCDLIESNRFNVVCLTEIFRQASESLIITNAHRVNGGSFPELHVTDRDFFYLNRPYSQIVSTISQLINTRLPRAYGEDIREKIQVITPSRKGRAGTEALNVMLQSCLNPPSRKKREIRAHGMVFREGDKVMQTRNNYDVSWEKNGVQGTGVFNGDIGIITQINEADKQISIFFDDRLAIYEFAMLEDIDLAYAISVHKSQGSEYPVIVLPLYDCPEPLRTRNLFYTAITRAKEMVILVGDEGIAEQMVENNRHVMRYTLLKERLQK